MNARRIMVLSLLAAALPLARAQSLGNSPGSVPLTSASRLDLRYTRPTEKTKIHNYFFDAFGPYPIVGAAFVAGVNQAYNSPPEWKQGAEGYGKRFGSNLGIETVSTTTRYGLAEAFREDTLYYGCECRGAFRRLTHAMISTLTARRGEDGHRVTKGENKK